MIDLYTWCTPNGHKVHIMLEETGLAYTVHPVDITAGDQFDPDFLALSPNNKIPVIVDQDGPGGKPMTVFESGAILLYLAEKAEQFLPPTPRERYITWQWLMFQMGNIGPLLGQAHHFHVYTPEAVPYAKHRYAKEANRLYAVLDRRLAEVPFLAGAHYTIADMATFPWLQTPENQGVNLDSYPHVKQWRHQIAARPAVERGLTVLADKRREGPLDDQAQNVLFGDAQYRRR